MPVCGTKIVEGEGSEWHCPNCHTSRRVGIFSILWQEGPAPTTCPNEVTDKRCLPPLTNVEDSFRAPALFGRLGGAE
jgi:hypothetical protein